MSSVGDSRLKKRSFGMRKAFLPVVAIAALMAVVTLSLAQGGNARGSAEATINGKQVTIDYGRPELKGRSLEELTSKLPEDRIWRAGMNQVTTLETGTDLMVGGKKIPVGKYSVYVHAPASGEWSLVLNSVLGQPLKKIWAEAPENMANEPWPHFAYTKEIGDQEVARVPMKKAEAASTTDTFIIDLQPAGDGAVMKMSWGNSAWSVDLNPPE
jgi:hypothetical protein